LFSSILVGGTLIHAAEYVEIKVELNSTWRSKHQTNNVARTATCIVGTNDWYIAGNFLKNAHVEYWLVGSNVMELRKITSGMYLEQFKDFVSEKILRQPPRSLALESYPSPGEKIVVVHPSPLGQPAGHGMENAAWLAFCSGDYLKKKGRQIPMPVGPSSFAFGYSDRTIVFNDTFGLPRSVQLFATNGVQVCEYEVLQATNFFGRTFPIKFQLVQYGQPYSGMALMDSRLDLVGSVTAIQIGKQPKLPDEAQKKVEK
jgi:hypothetical protein